MGFRLVRGMVLLAGDDSLRAIKNAACRSFAVAVMRLFFVNAVRLDMPKESTTPAMTRVIISSYSVKPV